MATEEVNRVLAAVIVLVIGIAFFNIIFSQPELDDMARETAHSMADAINQAADLPVSNNEPSLSETDKYVPVIMRFGEPLNIFNGWSVTLGGKQPSYEIYYEHFPDETPLGFFTTWTESYPWSGGLVAQLATYGLIRSVTLGLGSKTGRKVVGGIAKGIAFPFRMAWEGFRFLLTYPARLALALSTDQEVLGTKMLANWMKNSDLGGFVFTGLKATWDSMDDNKWLKKTITRQKDVYNDLLIYGFKEGADSGANNRAFFKTVLKSGGNFGFDDTGRVIPEFDDIDQIRRAKTAVGFMSSTQKARLFENMKSLPSVNWRRLTEYIRGSRVANSWVWKSRGWEIAKKAGRIITWTPKKIYHGIRWVRSEFRRAVEWYRYGKLVSKEDTIIARTVQKEVMNQRARNGLIKKLGARIVGMTDDQLNFHRIVDVADSGINSQNVGLVFSREGPGYAYDSLGDYMKKLIGRNDHLADDVTFSALESVDNNMYRGIVDKAGRVGLSEIDAQVVWEAARKGYPVHGTDSIKRAAYKTFFEDALRGVYDPVTSTFTPDNPYMVQQLQAIAAGELQPNPVRTLTGRRIGRFFLFDFGKYKNPFALGAQVTQQAEENILDSYDYSTENSLVFVSKGQVSAIQLDPKVASYPVKLYRKKQTVAPVGPQTALFYLSVVDNPRYYTVSPCFGIAKVWKGVDDNGATTIFVRMDEEDSMCGGAPCDPEDPDCDPEECANYCYATSQRIFGRNGNQPSEYTITAVVGVTVPCMLCPTCGGWPVCSKLGAAAGYAVLAGMIADHTAHDDSCTDTYWSYWNYYVAADMFDWMENLITSGVSKAKALQKAGKMPVAGKATSKLQKIGTAGTGKWGSRSLKGLTDLALIPETLGDASSAWTTIGIIKYGIDKEHIQENQAQCVWGTPEEEEAREAIYGNDEGGALT